MFYERLFFLCTAIGIIILIIGGILILYSSENSYLSVNVDNSSATTKKDVDLINNVLFQKKIQLLLLIY